MRQIKQIIIHCADTPASMDIGVKEIRRWHLDRGFTDIGYHHVIRRNGKIEDGRPHHQVGAHVKGHNMYSIGVCMVGGKGANGQPESNFTRAQWTRLEALVTTLVEAYPGAEVGGHRDYTKAKSCPSFDAVAWWGAVE